MNQSQRASVGDAVSRRQFCANASAMFLSGLTAKFLCGDEPPPVTTTGEWIKRGVDEAPLKMQFRGTTADECQKWQAEFRAKLRKLLGPFQPPLNWKTHVRSSVDFPDFRRDELLLEAHGFPSLPVHLLLPRPTAKQRRPGILALHGHGEYGHHPVAGRDDLPGVQQSIESANYDYGRQLVRSGYAVAAPCFQPFGDRLGKRDPAGKFDPCADTFIRLQILGKVLMAENLRDSLWALDMLARHPEVNGERLGCIGLSYGGRMTMLTAALEPRIRVAAVSGALNVMQERVGKPYSCGAQIIPGLLQYGDVPEIGSLIAPRHCVWEVGSRDSLISPRWADEAISRMSRAYTALGAGERLLVDRFDGGHRWNGAVAVPLLERLLRDA